MAALGDPSRRPKDQPEARIAQLIRIQLMSRRALRIALVGISPIWFCVFGFWYLIQISDLSEALFTAAAVPGIALALLPLFLAWRLREGASRSVALPAKGFLVVVGGALGAVVLLLALVLLLMVIASLVFGGFPTR
ncbi:MAG: hypothetical protein AAF657_03345 [Acidobacteriota bacterium]